MIPALKDDAIDAQVIRLRMVLMEFTGLDQIVFISVILNISFVLI